MDAPTDMTTADDVTALPLERPAPESTWPAFADSYGRALLAWLKKAGLNAEDAHKVLRTVMAYIHREFAEVVNESSWRFRSWLDYVIHKGWCRAVESLMQVQSETEQTPLLKLLLSNDALDDLKQSMDRECTRLRRRELLVRAQALVSPSDWQAFYTVVLEGLPPDEAAARLGLRMFEIQAAVFRVHRLLLDDLHALEEKY